MGLSLKFVKQPGLYTAVLGIIAAILLFGCSEEGTPSTHPDGWADPVSDNFHASKIAGSGIESCGECHGVDYYGGSSEVSCYTCHSSGPSGHPGLMNWINPDSAEFHGKVLWDNGWDLGECQLCHGENLNNGGAVQGCQTSACHVSNDGVYSCDNCHSSDDSTSFVDLRNNTTENFRTVRIHNIHLSKIRYTTPLSCNECHLVPDKVDDAGHLDGVQGAEVQFGTLATDNDRVTPVWDSSTGTCSNVYCHGNFEFSKSESENVYAYTSDTISGNNLLLEWNKNNHLLCNDCHSLPPTGHMDVPNCGSCHSSVIGSDNITIVDKSQHINGEKNYP